MTTIRELVTNIGFDVDDKSIQDFDSAVSEVTNTLAALGTAAIAGGGALFAFAQSAANTGDRLAKTARDVGITAEVLQELEFAYGLAGVGEAELSKGLERFSRTIGEAARGSGTGKKALEELGVSLYDANGNLKDNETLLQEVTVAMGNIQDASIRTSLTQDLLGRSGTRMGTAMADGGEALAAAREEFRELGGMSEQGAKNSEEFNDTMARMSVVVNSIKMLLAEELIPVITDVVKNFIEWMKANRELIATRLQAFMRGLIRFIKAVVDAAVVAWKTFATFAEIVGGVENAFKLIIGTWLVFKALSIAQAIWTIVSAFRGITLATWLWNAALLANPIILVIGLIIALIAILWVWFGDNEAAMNYIRDLWDRFVGYIYALWERFASWFVDRFKIAMELASDLWALIVNAAEYVFEAIGELIDWFVDKFEQGLELVSDIWTWLGEKVDEIFEAIGNLIDLFVEKFEQGIEIIAGIWEWLSEQVGKFFDLIGKSITWLLERFAEFGRGALKVWNVIGEGIGEVFNGVRNILGSVFDSLRQRGISAINWLIRQVNKIPGVNFGEIGQDSTPSEAVSTEDVAPAIKVEMPDLQNIEGLVRQESLFDPADIKFLTDSIDSVARDAQSLMMSMDDHIANISRALPKVHEDLVRELMPIQRIVNVDSEIIVNVPPGFEQQQAAFIRSAARDSFRQEYERNLQNALLDNPDLE